MNFTCCGMVIGSCWKARHDHTNIYKRKPLFVSIPPREEIGLLKGLRIYRVCRYSVLFTTAQIYPKTRNVQTNCQGNLSKVALISTVYPTCTLYPPSSQTSSTNSHPQSKQALPDENKFPPKWALTILKRTVLACFTGILCENRELL